MSHPYPMASVFTEGMRRDSDRTMLPGGSVWNLVDFIPDEIQAAASGRGGWTYAGPVLSGATQAFSVAYHPDLAKVVVLTNFQTVWDAVAGTSFSSSGPPYFNVSAPPAYHRGYLIYGSSTVLGLIQSPSALRDDGTVSTLTNAPPAFLPGVYKDHALLAALNTGLGPSHGGKLNRLFFSAAGDPTTWDQNFGWWDTTGTITALGTTPNAILIFHSSTTERLRGTTPPPGSDMTIEPFFDDGCLDPFSVAYWQENVIFASSRGIYLTNGASVVDLTAQAQIKTYWASLVSGYSSSWRIAGGIFRDHYIVSINNGSALVDCLCINLTNRTSWRFSNLHGSCFVNVTTSTQEKLYMGQWNAGRVAELSSLWSPSASVKQDGDGTNPTPIIETGAFRGYDRLHRRWIQSMGKQMWRWAYMDYDLRDAATDNPTISLSAALSPGGPYTALTGGTLPETTDYTRKKRSIGKVVGGGKRSNMIEFKIAVNGPYATANLYALEADFAPIDIGRL